MATLKVYGVHRRSSRHGGSLIAWRWQRHEHASMLTPEGGSATSSTRNIKHFGRGVPSSGMAVQPRGQPQRRRKPQPSKAATDCRGSTLSGQARPGRRRRELAHDSTRAKQGDTKIAKRATHEQQEGTNTKEEQSTKKTAAKLAAAVQRTKEEAAKQQADEERRSEACQGGRGSEACQGEAAKRAKKRQRSP